MQRKPSKQRLRWEAELDRLHRKDSVTLKDQIKIHWLIRKLEQCKR